MGRQVTSKCQIGESVTVKVTHVQLLVYKQL